jgi:hypothetical protein
MVAGDPVRALRACRYLACHRRNDFADALGRDPGAKTARGEIAAELSALVR